MRLLAESVKYIGSPEHKRHPSFAGQPAPRADASICDPAFADRQEELTTLLREAVVAGTISGFFEGKFPRYVWMRQVDQVFEARLVNRELGHYKGYALNPDELPEGV